VISALERRDLQAVAAGLCNVFEQTLDIPDSLAIKKMMLDAGKYKWPALYWQSAERVINKEFGINDKVDIVFNLTRDFFKGNETPQIMIVDLKKSE
jgi:single-stranded-DNA-specific exonuclease